MGKIYLAEKTQLDGVGTPFVTCSTAAATAAKTVTVSGFTLKTGTMISVKFTYANTASNPTLNVNNTGAKSIYYHNLAAPAGMFVAGGVYLLVYNGSRWDVMGNHMVPSSASSSDSKSLLFDAGYCRDWHTGDWAGATFFNKQIDVSALSASGYNFILVSYLYGYNDSDDYYPATIGIASSTSTGSSWLQSFEYRIYSYTMFNEALPQSFLFDIRNITGVRAIKIHVRGRGQEAQYVSFQYGKIYALI